MPEVTVLGTGTPETTQTGAGELEKGKPEAVVKSRGGGVGGRGGGEEERQTD